MFIDADIGFDYKTIFRMLALDKEVVASIYPRKAIDWRKVKNKVESNPDVTPDELHAFSLQYNLNVKDPERVAMKQGFIEVMDEVREEYKKTVFNNLSDEEIEGLKKEVYLEVKQGFSSKLKGSTASNKKKHIQHS
jgi:hypothetical protein